MKLLVSVVRNLCSKKINVMMKKTRKLISLTVTFRKQMFPKTRDFVILTITRRPVVHRSLSRDNNRSLITILLVARN